MSTWTIVALVAIGILVYAAGIGRGLRMSEATKKEAGKKEVGVALNGANKGDDLFVALGELPPLSVDAVDLLEIGLITQEQFNQLLSRRARS